MESYIQLFGQRIQATKIEHYLENIPRFTYRKNFPPLKNEYHFFNMRSDSHWGCCIRCGQSMLFQYLKKVYLKNMIDAESQKHPPNHPLEVDHNTELRINSQILRDFNDTPNAKYSIHNFCREITNIGGHEGKYTSLTRLAKAIQHLLAPEYPVYVAEQSTIVREQVLELFQQGKPVLCLVPTIFGIDKLDQESIYSITVSVAYETGIGFIGGIKKKAFYFVGYNNDTLYYFDPHSVKNFVSTEADYKTYYESKLKSMPFNSISSSLMLCFCWDNPEQMNSTAKLLTSIQKSSQINFVDSAVSLQSEGRLVDSWDVIDEVQDDFIIVPTMEEQNESQSTKESAFDEDDGDHK